MKLSERISLIVKADDDKIYQVWMDDDLKNQIALSLVTSNNGKIAISETPLDGLILEQDDISGEQLAFK